MVGKFEEAIVNYYFTCKTYLGHCIMGKDERVGLHFLHLSGEVIWERRWMAAHGDGSRSESHREKDILRIPKGRGEGVSRGGSPWRWQILSKMIHWVRSLFVQKMRTRGTLFYWEERWPRAEVCLPVLTHILPLCLSIHHSILRTIIILSLLNLFLKHRPRSSLSIFPLFHFLYVCLKRSESLMFLVLGKTITLEN